MPTPPASILHVFDPAHAGWPVLVALSILQHRPGHRLVALGASGDRRVAREFGIERAEFCPAPARLPFSAAWCLRGLIARGNGSAAAPGSIGADSPPHSSGPAMVCALS